MECFKTYIYFDLTNYKLLHAIEHFRSSHRHVTHITALMATASHIIFIKSRQKITHYFLIWHLYIML